jgi:ABC-type Mn2+/Zn2+ transport system permease subunit
MAGALCGALGPYLVWRRMGLLGDAIAHAGLAVVAVSLLLDISSTPLLLVFAALIGYLLSFAQEKNFSELDSVLAILFAGFMGLGLLIIHFSGKGSEEILHVLFGDVSQTNSFDLIVLAALSAFVVSYLLWFRKPLQLMLLHSDLARIEGVQIFQLY